MRTVVEAPAAVRFTVAPVAVTVSGAEGFAFGVRRQHHEVTWRRGNDPRRRRSAGGGAGKQREGDGESAGGHGASAFTSTWVPRTPMIEVGVCRRTDSGASFAMSPDT